MTPRAVDYILELSYDAGDDQLEERIQSYLFLTPGRGSSSQERSGRTALSAFFDTPKDREAAAQLLRPLGVSLQMVDRERVDWLERYEQSLEPTLIGERFVVVPDSRLIPQGLVRLPVIIPQEQAFGTGSHETTALCITLLESLPTAGKRGLDIGSGSGILAIAMHRLGATKVMAFDNDTDAYGALRDNRIRNDVPESAMPLFIGGIEALRGGEFDVITMNILPEVILPILGKVVQHLAPGGVLILSGILTAVADDVVRAAAGHGLRLRDPRVRGEWWAGALAKN